MSATCIVQRHTKLKPLQRDLVWKNGFAEYIGTKIKINQSIISVTLNVIVRYLAACIANHA